MGNVRAQQHESATPFPHRPERGIGTGQVVQDARGEDDVEGLLRTGELVQHIAAHEPEVGQPEEIADELAPSDAELARSTPTVSAAP